METRNLEYRFLRLPQYSLSLDSKVHQGKENHYGFFRPTEEVLGAWHRTEEVARALRAEVVLFQCPPRFREDEESVENMRAFFMYADALRFTRLLAEEG